MHILTHQQHNLPAFAVTALIVCLGISACNSDRLQATRMNLEAPQGGGGGAAAVVGQPADNGVANCVKACRVFMATQCNTAAATFCRNPERSCEVRYNAHAKCGLEMDAMDTCAALQAAGNFACPLGAAPNDIRPYRLSEDACVTEAKSLGDCLKG